MQNDVEVGRLGWSGHNSSSWELQVTLCQCRRLDHQAQDACVFFNVFLFLPSFLSSFLSFFLFFLFFLSFPSFLPSFRCGLCYWGPWKQEWTDFFSVNGERIQYFWLWSLLQLLYSVSLLKYESSQGQFLSHQVWSCSHRMWSGSHRMLFGLVCRLAK